MLRPLRFAVPFLLLLPLAACRSVPQRPPAPPPPGPAAMLAAIHDAGRHDGSIVQVKPLRDAATAALLARAQREEAARHYARAAAVLDHALAQAPDAPDLLQDRAELAIRLGHFAVAERLARRSYRLGPRVGSLCARNWQTVAELRRHAGDAAGARAARKHLAGCRVRGPVRM